MADRGAARLARVDVRFDPRSLLAIALALHKRGELGIGRTSRRAWKGLSDIGPDAAGHHGVARTWNRS